MKKKKDERTELRIRYRFDEDGKVHFIDPCVDEIPIDLFCLVCKRISEAEKEWNEQITASDSES